MKIKIISCSNDLYWYNRLVGKEIECEEIDIDNEFIISIEEMRKYVIPSLSTIKGVIGSSDAIIINSIISDNNISDLFEDKVKYLRGFEEGEKVTYIRDNKKENGIVKSSNMQDKTCFVVYNWGDDPDLYINYTGALTDFKYLKRGWI